MAITPDEGTLFNPERLQTYVETVAVLSDDISQIVVITQADYDELDPPDPTTLYVIRG